MTTEDMQFAERNKHISVKQIKQDIADTKAEIKVMVRQTEALRVLADRVSLIRALARERGIEERRVFVTKLEQILEIRKGF